MEALAQTGAVGDLSLPENKGKIAYFGAVDKCRFKGKVIPGDKTVPGNTHYPNKKDRWESERQLPV